MDGELIVLFCFCSGEEVPCPPMPVIGGCLIFFHAFFFHAECSIFSHTDCINMDAALYFIRVVKGYT